MRVADNLLALEKVIEQGILGFFVLLGASEAPENWQGELQEAALSQDGRESPEAHYQDRH
jgi:hypothetical protein